jgi:hypothetical protein
MTVYVAHAPADRAAAEALERAIERRGQFVELDDGHTALRPIEASDVLVLLSSRAFELATARLRLEQRALDAWAEGRLIVVKLDGCPASVGLRDLPAIDASVEAERERAWQQVADAVGQTSPARAEADEAPRAASARRGVLATLLMTVLAAPGLVAIAAAASIWLVNRIGPTPGGWPELRRGIDQFGMRYGAASGVAEWLFLAAITLTIAVAATMIVRVLARPRAKPEATPSRSDALFVSYARANAPAVLPMLEAAKRAGRRFRLDQQGAAAGEGWAGELVRAIRGAAGVVVMCSKAAFDSDHVKREIYLADRYRKKLVPVFIEQAEPPEDFQYFFAGAQSLNLFETPEAERPQALMRAIGAA